MRRTLRQLMHEFSSGVMELRVTFGFESILQTAEGLQKKGNQKKSLIVCDDGILMRTGQKYMTVIS